MASSSDLAELIDRYAEREGLIEETALPRVMLVKSTRRTEPIHSMQSAAVCIIASGRKRVMLGQDVFTYDPEQYLIASVDLPLVGEVIEATPEEPYLCFVLKLDPAMLARCWSSSASSEAAPRKTGPALSLGKVSPELLDAAVRLMRLLETPADIRRSPRSRNARSFTGSCAAGRPKSSARSRSPTGVSARSTARSTGSSAIFASRSRWMRCAPRRA
ncbi:AraC family transcriptional regulator [Chenggangzhangella methanolivorans]|uniref:AraC family transcriptional regulator n=1 Tax=Chenggangzhangella methanolivorans TaxID=1437009 RepID=UPI0021BDE653|nr:AraC family transcriptional regulator [Chenggangzhangella methanolivorans]